MKSATPPIVICSGCRNLFWVPNVNPITLSYPLNAAHDLTRLLSLDMPAQLGGIFMIMVTSRETLIPIFGALLLVIFSISSRKHYHVFLARASSRVARSRKTSSP